MISLTALGNGATDNNSFGFTSMADGIVSDRTTTSFRINFGGGHYVDVTGSDFVYDLDADALAEGIEVQTTPLTGTVSGYSIHQGDFQYDVAGLNEPVAALNDPESIQALINDLASAESLIVGGSGDDVFNGGEGNDTIISGSGSDIVFGHDGDDNINAGDGDDIITGGKGNDTILAGEGDDGVSGNEGDDTIYAGNGDNAVYSHDGNDTVVAGDGYDWIETGEGNDTIYGGGQSDSIYAGAGDDRIFGEDGHDSLYGDDGDDVISGGEGHDYAEGGAGEDVITGGEGNDYLLGGDGVDIIDGGNGNDGLVGGAGNDILTSGAGEDFLNGGAGDDYIFSGAGSDEVYGGTGADLFDYQSQDDLGDVYRDFTSLDNDKLQFAGVVFQDLDEGTLNSRYFTANNTGLATHGLHKFVFNTSSKQLWFDFNGNDPSHAGVLVATFVNGEHISASDIVINRDQEGTSGDDVMDGGRYADHFTATAGNDTYSGYDGADDYTYNDVAFGGDTITDFNIAHGDTVRFKSENFGGLELGTLSADNFVLNDTGLAEDSDDFFIFNTEDLSLTYDADGDGEGTGVHIATFENTDEYSYVTNENILVIA